ncbi:MFS general substrate transporter [Acephala macrosclerotiorum]|nr:MFS general substrate transporter [Acephala macrosclerotiorum]
MQAKKAFVVFIGIIAILNSTFDSTLPSGSIDSISDAFRITNPAQLALPTSIFLVGYILGPIFFGPLSETYGRRIIMVPTFLLFTIFTLACALAKSFMAFIWLRLMCGIFASSSIAVTSGMYADIYADPRARGRAIALYISATAIGPQFAPMASGFVSTINWRWTFWVGLIIAGVSLSVIFFLPETYGPAILKSRARRMRKPNPRLQVTVQHELERPTFEKVATVILMRPLRMLVAEPVVLFSCLYLALATAIFFLFFEAYPLIFEGIYGMEAGVAGLAFIPIALGSCLAFIVCLVWDHYLEKAKQRNLPWANLEEYRRLPLACLGGPLYVISLFWVGWTSSVNIHWIVPILGGIPFGAGFVLIFIALLNFMADAYREYASSASAAASICRSIFGAVIPLAGAKMYKTLGMGWGNSLLGFLSLGMCMVPFVMIKYGRRILENSTMSKEILKNEATKLEQERENVEATEV